MTPQHLDLDQIPDTPNRRAHHRRAQSETFIRFPDFDDDSFLDDVVFDLPPAPTLSSDTNSAPSQLQQLQPDQSQPLKSSEKAHFRSLSVDAGFFEGLYFGASSAATDGGGGGGGCVPASAGLVGPRHRYSSSMDGLAASDMTSSFEAMMVDSAKKADRLQELALIDPKKVKRILANRQSAARSKERKTRYTNELERKVQTLQTEATTLSAQVTMMQRDTTGLTAENKELKLRLQALEQQAHLRDALNEALREEVQRLRKATGHMPAGNGSNFNRGPPPQFSSQQPNFDQYCNQAKHDQQQPQQKIHMPHSTINNPAFNPQSKPSFLDFNQKA